MSSSTSDSERRFVRSALAAFVCGALALIVPYEIVVRASEHRYGVRRANIVLPRSLSPKVDFFLAEFGDGVRYAAYAVGTSRVEAAIRPDVLDGVLGPTYNAGLGGTSSVAALEFFESLGLKPSRLIVSVSPMDFTPLAIQRGEKGVARARSSSPGSMGDERSPAAYSRAAFRALLHSSAPERRRNLGQWLMLWRERGSVLAFLNNEDATGPLGATATRGWVPATKVASAADMSAGQGSNIPGEYAAGRGTTFPRMAALIRRFQQRGAVVTLVRIPTTAAMRRAEDAETSFDADVRELSRSCGAAYVDGFALMGPEFASDGRNFTDSEHLNSRGALQFSRALAQALR